MKTFFRHCSISFSLSAGYYGLDCQESCRCGNGAKCDHVAGNARVLPDGLERTAAKVSLFEKSKNMKSVV